MTTTGFHGIRDAVLAGVDELFAEQVELKFMIDGRSDPDRENTVVVAPLRVGEGKNTNLTGGVAKSWRSRIVASKAQLHIDPATYSGPKPQKGDRVRAVTRPGEPWFDVLHVDDRSHTRLVLELGEL